MTTEIDLRDQSEDERREHLFEAFEDADTGDDFDVVADRDLDPHLVRYQIDRDRVLKWEYEDPDAEPRRLRITVAGQLDDDTLGSMDVRDLKPQRRHEALLEIFDTLGADEGFVLVNDHDPKPLYHEIRAMHGDVIDWEYTSRGSGEWRVEIGKTENSDADDQDIVTRYDVRDIPEEERHPTIHHRYGMLPEGGTMELIAPHEPKPLHREFDGQYGDAFTWEVLESEPARCRVQVTKDENVREDDGQPAPENEGEVGAAPADEGTIAVIDKHDVRDLPPAQRHERVFDAYDDLAAGTGFVLVNDHDPKPLYHQFEAEAGPEFRWVYRQQDPGEFRVMIGKAETVGAGVPDEETTP